MDILHRDIKPENILLDENFEVKLCDFGWSCFHKSEKMRESLCGTYEYMSPEIIYARKHDKKADIWSLGILLYEMLHGYPPFSAENMKDMKKQFSSKNILLRRSIH